MSSAIRQNPDTFHANIINFPIKRSIFIEFRIHYGGVDHELLRVNALFINAFLRFSLTYGAIRNSIGTMTFRRGCYCRLRFNLLVGSGHHFLYNRLFFRNFRNFINRLSLHRLPLRLLFLLGSGGNSGNHRKSETNNKPQYVE